MTLDSVNDSDPNGGVAKGSGCQFFMDRSTNLRKLLLKLHADDLAKKLQPASNRSMPTSAANHVASAVEAIATIETTVCELRTMMEVYVDKEGNRINPSDKEAGKGNDEGAEAGVGAGAGASAQARARGKGRECEEDEGATASRKPTPSKPSLSVGVRTRLKTEAPEVTDVEQQNPAIDWRFDRVCQIEHSFLELMAE